MMIPCRVNSVVAIGVSALLALAPLCHGEEQNHLFGGNPIDKKDFLWLSSISDGIEADDFLCGGALISPRHVITADHCLDDKTVKSLLVRIGYFCPRSDNCGRPFRHRSVNEIRRDPSLGDIAILVLSKKVKSIFEPIVPDVGSPSILSRVGRGGDMMMVGAGRDGTTSDVLAKRAETLTLQLHSRKYKTCRNAISNEKLKDESVSKATICSTSNEGKPCRGDSGSAVVVDNVIVAVHNYGPRYCSSADDDTLLGQVAVSAVADFVVSVVCLGNNKNDEKEVWCPSPISCPSFPLMPPQKTIQATLRHDLKDVHGSVYSVAFDATSSYLASASGTKNRLKLWYLPAGGSSPLRTVRLDRCCPDSLAFHPNGTILAVDNGDDIALVNMEDTNNQDAPRQLPGHTDGAEGLTWHPDGTMFASGGRDHSVKLWDIASGNVRHTFQAHQDIVHSVSFDPQGRHVVSASVDKTLRVWDVLTLQHVRTMEGHNNTVHSVAYSPDGERIASGSFDGTVRIWRASNGSPLGVFQVGSDVFSVAWSSDNQFLVSGSEDGIVRVWDAVNVTEAALVELEEHSACVNSVAWSSNGKWIASGGSDRAVKVWEVGFEEKRN